MRFKLPFAIFIMLAILLAVGLRRDPKLLPSALIDKPAPAIDLPLLHDPQQTLKVDGLRGQVWLLNVWASWCAPCRDELPVLTELAGKDGVVLYGLNYKDKTDAARTWLQRWGNPYRGSAVDGDGRIGMDYGVYGVPETFVIDRSGRIRYRHTGPLTSELWRERLPRVVQQWQVDGGCRLVDQGRRQQLRVPAQAHGQQHCQHDEDRKGQFEAHQVPSCGLSATVAPATAAAGRRARPSR